MFWRRLLHKTVVPHLVPMGMGSEISVCVYVCVCSVLLTRVEGF